MFGSNEQRIENHYLALEEIGRFPLTRYHLRKYCCMVSGRQHSNNTRGGTRHQLHLGANQVAILAEPGNARRQSWCTLLCRPRRFFRPNPRRLYPSPSSLGLLCLRSISPPAACATHLSCPRWTFPARDWFYAVCRGDGRTALANVGFTKMVRRRILVSS